MPNQYHNLGWLLITLSNYDLFFTTVALRQHHRALRGAALF
jgi:hypothetical protein